MGEFDEAVGRLSGARRMGKGRPRRSESDVLHARIIWTAWENAEGGQQLMRSRYLMRRGSEDSPLVMRSDEYRQHQDGVKSLSRLRLQALLARHPHLANLIDWPIGLLDLSKGHRPIHRAWFKRYTEKYADEFIPFDIYRFPDGTSCTTSDKEALYERGDAYGFLGLLIAYRNSHQEHRVDSQWFTATWLIRALPAFCRDSSVRPHARKVIELTMKLLILLPDTCFRIRVTEKILWDQINGITHEPSRRKRLAAAQDDHQIPEPIDPIVPYRYQRCRTDQVPILLAGINHRLERPDEP
ncbi:hypothetical protein [Lysobacter sp. TAB13]|uniref:hypothetical protein n=1 Tax=Lysobacter sp. TAB13 TaxID=3233065 RepID=UPI003F977F0A